MDQVENVAAETLSALIDECAEIGLTDLWRVLVQDVYAANLGRYEPDELGDTPMTLGIQCSENLKTRALRQARHDDLESPDDHWDIFGLEVCTPRNTLTFHLGAARIVVMKAPFAEGRAPRWEQLGDWDHDSQVRHEVASSNSRSLQYRTHLPVDDPLFTAPTTIVPSAPRNYMLVWAGEAHDPRTAGWLTVPALGESPFIARAALWWDDEPEARLSGSTKPQHGPRFDERQGAAPQVTLKPRPAAEGQA